MSLTRIQRFLRHGSLPQLTAFEAVVRLGSFTRAAEALHMAQPTVSQHLRKLSERIGHPLIKQVGRHVQPTTTGQLLYEAAQDIFHTLERFEQRAEAVETMAAGTLRLAVCDEAMGSLMPVLERFMASHPELSLQVERGCQARLQARMADDEDDLYLMTGLSRSLGVVRQRVADMPLLLVAAPDHPLAGQIAVDLVQVAQHGLLLQAEGSAIRKQVEQVFTAQGLQPTVRLVIDDNNALRDAVMRGLGLAVMPAAAVAPAGATDRLAVIAADGFPLHCEWCFAYPVGKRLSAAARAFLACARQFDLQRSRWLDPDAVGTCEWLAATQGGALREPALRPS
ncbi:MAG TPA: LysR family transcriptional regulator [Rhodocyclaceae bacterium]|nr:LysR family transcriptional regulator [Rhodocyclaceae bacterium]